MLKQGINQVFYFDDFLGTTAFDENSLERNEDKQLLNFLQAVHNSGGTKKLILTSRDYILRQARLSLESVRTTDLKPYLCIIDLQNYTRFNKAEILYNHLYFSDLSEKHIADLLKDKQYLAIIDHPNYSPRVIEWMTQMKNRWPQHEQDFAVAFLDALDNPMDLWKHAFERNLSISAKYVLWVLISLPDRIRIDDLEHVFTLFQRYMAEHFMHTIDATDFHNALEEIEGTFIEIDILAAGVRTIRFHNPSIRDFLEAYLPEHIVVINLLVRSAQFFSQLRWLWGKYQIGFRHAKKPVQIRPRYRELLLRAPDDFVQSLTRTIYSERPFLNITTKADRRSFCLASRLLLLNEVNRILNDIRLSDLITNSMPVLKTHAELGKESSFEIMKLAKRLRGTSYFPDIKAAFLVSLISLIDFERFLIFKLRYSDELSTSDEAFAERRFSELYPGEDMSYIEASEDYGYDNEYDLESFDYDDDDRDWSEHTFAVIKEVEEIEQHKSDPNESITNLFDGLSG